MSVSQGVFGLHGKTGYANWKHVVLRSSSSARQPVKANKHGQRYIHTYPESHPTCICISSLGETDRERDNPYSSACEAIKARERERERVSEPIRDGVVVIILERQDL